MKRFPEVPLVIAGFLLHFAWEVVQCPVFFVGMGDASHADGVAMCLRATVGDVNILLVAFWTTALASRRHRTWIRDPLQWELALFVGIGVAITIAYEILATRVWHRWAYSDAMPVLFGVGLTPVAQWLVIPPLVVRLMRKNARSAIFSALALAMLPRSAAAHGTDVEVEKCHLLCTTESGRVASRTSPAPIEGTGLDAVVEIAGISPLGAYAGGAYRPRPRETEAWAVQVLPSLTWYPRDGIGLTVAWPQETNRSRGVVLPTLHAQDASFSETAPGRISAHGRVRLPDGGWTARPWVGLGYALSDPIGTDDIRPSIDEIPEQGLEALGVGTDDAFATLELAGDAGPWRFGTGIEARIHALPRFERLYGTSVAWHAGAERSLSGRWSADVRLSGFRTLVVAAGESQSNALIIRTSLHCALQPGTRVTAGLSAEIPGTAANENALQTVGLLIGIRQQLGRVR